MAMSQQPCGSRRRRPTSALLVATIAGAAVAASLLSWKPIQQQAIHPANGEASFGIPQPAFFEIFGGGEEPEAQAPDKDWKETAWKRQQEKLNARKRRADPNYKESEQEKVKRLQREYRWKKAQRQPESVAMIGETMTVKVEMAPPFGMQIDTAQGGVMIKAVSQERGNAQYQNVRPGDRMVSVNGISLADNMDIAMQELQNAQGPVKFVLARPVSDL
mmetsp:Transcript_59992/g.119042  ORF Transcript_59992/g.119042 Transcript_59992/m.119042 type:complete len:218 (+) Transcript_59992:58-711(+)